MAASDALHASSIQPNALENAVRVKVPENAVHPNDLDIELNNSSSPEISTNLGTFGVLRFWITLVRSVPVLRTRKTQLPSRQPSRKLVAAIRGSGEFSFIQRGS
jgi:hypothetical protein